MGKKWGETGNREGANEERIGDDLWGACRCRRNNIIVNFAIAALSRQAEREEGGRGPLNKRANNGE